MDENLQTSEHITHIGIWQHKVVPSVTILLTTEKPDISKSD